MRKRILNTLYYIFFALAVLFLIYRMYLRSNNRKEEAETMQWIAVALLVAALICRLIPKLFPKRFIDKSAKEEVGRQIHND